MSIEEAGKVASGVIDGLRQQPFALALVVVNVIFLAAGGWFLSKISERSEHRDALIMQLVKDCGRGG